MVEPASGFFETAFLSGRSFASSEDFNTQLGQWLPKANARLVRRSEARPTDLLGQDKPVMLALPPIRDISG